MNAVGRIRLTAKSTVDPNASDSITIEAFDPNAYDSKIYTYEQLNAVRNHLDKSYELCADIDMTGSNWTPIGTQNKPFTGTFTVAGNFQISNLGTHATYAGLFGYVKNAKIEGVTIRNASMTGDYVGAITGVAEKSQIKNCSLVNGVLSGNLMTGGIAGLVKTSSIVSDSYVEGIVKVSSVKSSANGKRYVGGIVGQSLNSSISNCNINVAGGVTLGSEISGYVGGIVGYTNSPIDTVAVRKAIIGANYNDTDYAGGIVGYTTSTISNATINNTTISGYYAGGIGGAINTGSSVSIQFNEYKNGYRSSDISSKSYGYDVTNVAVKEGTIVKGDQVGGLFGVISSGVVANCYTRATLNGSNAGAVKGGFASSILSYGFKNNGGSGSAGVVEYCYSACTFAGQGFNYSITESLVHNYATFGDGSSREAGFCFNYVFDNDIDGNAKYIHNSNMFASDKVESKKSTSEMKQKSTYTDKGFNSGIWSLGGDYPTLSYEV